MTKKRYFELKMFCIKALEPYTSSSMDILEKVHSGEAKRRVENSVIFKENRLLLERIARQIDPVNWIYILNKAVSCRTFNKHVRKFYLLLDKELSNK